MAFTANTAFEVKVSNHEFDSVANITGIFGSYSGDDFTAADCSAGILCRRVKLVHNEGYPSGVMNGNTWTMVANTASTTDDVKSSPIYACNTHNVQEIADGAGNVYKVGHRTLGLGIPAGELGTYTRIKFDGEHMYRFGVGNLSAALSTNGFLTLANGGQLTPAASAPTSGAYFTVVGSGNFTEGASQSFGYVDAIACYIDADVS